MTNFIKDRADEIGISAEDIAYQLAQRQVRVTSQAVRMWFRNETAPRAELVEPLAVILKTTKQKLLAGIHEMSLARKAKEPVGAK